MELAAINNLFLELSQFASVKTPRELAMEDLLRSARAIAVRRGKDTAWELFDARIAALGIGAVTPRVFKSVLLDEPENPILPAWFETFIRNVSELSCRTSPIDDPNIILASADELRACAISAIGAP